MQKLTLCLFVANLGATLGGVVTQTLSDAQGVTTVLSHAKRQAQTWAQVSTALGVLPSYITLYKDKLAFSKLSSAGDFFSAQPKGCAGHTFTMGKFSGGSYTCNSTSLTATLPFKCFDTSGGLLATVGAVTMTAGKVDKVTATVVGTAAEAHFKSGLMSWMLLNRAVYEGALDTISESNKKRHSAAQGYAAGLYFMIGCLMLQLIVLGTMWMNWLWQPLKSNETVPEGSTFRGYRQNVVMWLVVFTLVILICSILGGFMAWVVMGCLLFIFIMTANFCIYPIVRNKCPDWCPWGKFTDPETSELGGVSSDPQLLEEVAVPNTETASSELAADGEEEPKPANGAVNGSVEETSVCPSIRAGIMPEVIDEYDWNVVLVSWGLFLITTIILFIVFFPGWTIDEYYLWDRQKFQLVSEFQPSSVAKLLQMMYAYDKMATDFKFNTFADITTTYCNSKRDYVAEGDRQAQIYDEFVGKYSINMAEYDPSDWRLYNSANAWFIRKLAPGARTMCPSAFPTFSRSLASPADARVVGWQSSMEATRYWVKNTDVTASTMLGSVPSDISAATWAGGPLISFRLAPQDYHRFHAPVAGTILKIWEEGGSILSVSADAATSSNKVFLNSRKIVIIDSTCCGKVAYIAIGATCVGSVVLYKDAACTTTLKAGDTLALGDQMGIMQFGGSTVVLLFEKNRISLDTDIVRTTGSSTKYGETYMQMGETFAKAL